MPHVVLLGDSIFDNGAYVAADEPDVAEQLRALLPEGWSATLLAVDGDEIRHVHRQLARIPGGATNLVLSVGGNDALGHIGILDEPARSMPQALDRLFQIAAPFEREYRRLIADLAATGLPVALCTIYEGDFPDPELQRLTSTALTVFNDAIFRVAFEHGFPVLDLRLICSEPEHYANPIEPSAAGGEHIAAAIVRCVTEHDFERRRSEVFTGGSYA